MAEIIGWIGSVILVLSISKQVYKQWSEGTSEGVSIWLFIGRIASAVLLTIYSVLNWNAVFIFINVLLTIVGILGLIIMYRQKKDDKDTEG